jgi:hypothetical protein
VVFQKARNLGLFKRNDTLKKKKEEGRGKREEGRGMANTPCSGASITLPGTVPAQQIWPAANAATSLAQGAS